MSTRKNIQSTAIQDVGTRAATGRRDSSWSWSKSWSESLARRMEGGRWCQGTDEAKRAASPLPITPESDGRNLPSD